MSYAEFDFEWDGAFERDRDTVGELDDGGDSKRSRAAAVHGWDGKSDDHDDGMSAGYGDDRRERCDSAVRILDKYKWAGSGTGLFDEREYGGAIQRDECADIQCVWNIHERDELRASRRWRTFRAILITNCRAQQGRDRIAARTLLWREQFVQVGGGYDDGVQTFQRQHARHRNVDPASQGFLSGAEFDHERDGDDVQRQDDCGHWTGAGVWDSVLDWADCGGGVDDDMCQYDMWGGAVRSELLPGLDGYLHDRGKCGGIPDDWLDG